VASDVEIVNLALGHLGTSKEIALLTEVSDEARFARRFFETARDATLRDFPWPFSSTFVTLGLVATDPTEEWGFSYRYPSNCLTMRRILSGLRTDNRQSEASFKIGSDASGKLIFTDIQDAQAEYTVRVTDALQYPPDFVLAFSLRLAMYMAPKLTAGDPFRLGLRAAQMYLSELSKARATALNEEQPDEEPLSEFERSRA
jgi:hypothetical protein